jgi:hypothetical protein
LLRFWYPGGAEEAQGVFALLISRHGEIARRLGCMVISAKAWSRRESSKPETIILE